MGPGTTPSTTSHRARPNCWRSSPKPSAIRPVSPGHVGQGRCLRRGARPARPSPNPRPTPAWPPLCRNRARSPCSRRQATPTRRSPPASSSPRERSPPISTESSPNSASPPEPPSATPSPTRAPSSSCTQTRAGARAGHICRRACGRTRSLGPLPSVRAIRPRMHVGPPLPMRDRGPDRLFSERAGVTAVQSPWCCAALYACHGWHSEKQAPAKFQEIDSAEGLTGYHRSNLQH
jgi:hypothetical protein